MTINTAGITNLAGTAVVEPTSVPFPQTGTTSGPGYVAHCIVSAKGQSSPPEVYIPASVKRSSARFARIGKLNLRGWQHL